jgi:5-methylcytosine-specific restriction enzyme subunit McrC
MAGVPRLGSTLRGRLTHLDGRLDGVRVFPYRTAPPMWRPTRANARYGPALRLAEIVLRNQSAEPGPGGATVAAFVVSMPTVFEDFVTTALREALAPYPGLTHAQYPSHLAERERIPIRPDVVHVVNTRPAVVFDAKYKLESAGRRYPNADAYQMLAYCTALGLARGWLVYAQGLCAPDEYRVRNTAIDIVQYPLDLNVQPQQLLGQIGALVGAAMRGV